VATDLDIANRALSRLGAARIDSLSDDTKNARAANSALEAIREEVLADHPWNCATRRATVYAFTDDVEGVTFPVVGAFPRYRVALTGHGFRLNDPINITGIVGPTGANVGSLVGNVQSNSIDLIDPTTGLFRDSTGQSAYVSGGVVTLAGLYQHRFQYYLPSDCLRLLEVEGQRESDWLIESGKLVTDLDGQVNIRYIWRNLQTSTYPPILVSALQARLAAELALEVVDSPNKHDGALAMYQRILARAKKADGQEQTPAVIEESRWVTARLEGGTTFGGGSRRF
jgi:hypothetical protein